jgi:hypothetical protein
VDQQIEMALSSMPGNLSWPRKAVDRVPAAWTLRTAFAQRCKAPFDFPPANDHIGGRLSVGVRGATEQKVQLSVLRSNILPRYALGE